jgi:YbbR domain-containing protein
MDSDKKNNKNIFRFLVGLLSNNVGLKVASIIFAIVLWGFVMTEINPPREKTFNDINLKYNNTNNLAEKELIISDNLDDILQSVDIKIEANPDYLYLITEESINAYVDLSLINGTGEQVVAIKATSSIGTVVGISPKTITINVEDFLTRVIPVDYEIKNNLAADYFVSQPVITPESIEIKGARSLIEAVSTAVCYIDLHEITESFKQSFPLTFRDKSGEIIEADEYKEDLPSVIVDLLILPQKEVPINYHDSIFGLDNISEGFIVTNYWAEPGTVLVAAEQSILDTIVDVQLEGIDISGAKTDLSIQTNIKQIDGAIITTDPKGISINVEIMAQETTQIFEAVKVQTQNLKKGYEASVVPSSIKVIITGEELLLQDIQSSDLNIFIDLSGKLVGEYTVPIQFDTIEGINDNSIALFTEEVKVVISEK